MLKAFFKTLGALSELMAPIFSVALLKNAQSAYIAPRQIWIGPTVGVKTVLVAHSHN